MECPSLPPLLDLLGCETGWERGTESDIGELRECSVHSAFFRLPPDPKRTIALPTRSNGLTLRWRAGHCAIRG